MEEKEPVPVPFDALVDKTIVGLELVDQTIPLAVMEAPPSEVMLPPAVAEVVVIAAMEVVVKVGIETMEFVSFRQRMENPSFLTKLTLLVKLLVIVLFKLPKLRPKALLPSSPSQEFQNAVESLIL